MEPIALVAEALHHARARGLVHQDVKHADILVEARANRASQTSGWL